MSAESMLSKIGNKIDIIFAKIAKILRIVFYTTLKDKNLRIKYNKTQTIASLYTVLIFDSFIAFLSIFMSIHLRIGIDFLDYSPSYIIKNMVVFGLVSSSIFLWLQTYQSFWRYTSTEDIVSVFLSVALSNLLFFPLMLLMNQEDFLPYSILAINIFVQSIMLLMPRFLTRMLYDKRMKKLRFIANDIPPILILGNSNSVEVFLQEVFANEDIPFNFMPIGILTFNPDDVGRSIKGISIVGEVKNIGKVLNELQRENIFPKQIVVTEKSIPEAAKSILMRYVKEQGLLLMHVIHQFTFNPIEE
ncbi:MAG: hypothetical protein LBF70_01875 [Holosporales bacterium]|jgi:O-antigen biosynthesis protein WbqV|nr:hypothetical protein [Holosporales bacterium]